MNEFGNDWTGRSPINHIVNGGFNADASNYIGWASTGDVTLSIVSGKLRVNASLADKGAYQALAGLEPNTLYTLVCKVNTGGNEARVYTTLGQHNADETVKSAAETTLVSQCLSSATGTLTVYLTAHTTGANIDFDDVGLFRGNLAFPFVNEFFDSWRHNSDVTKIDGADISPGSLPTTAFPNQDANTVFSGPATGAAASPTFRALVDADIPRAIDNLRLTWLGW